MVGVWLVLAVVLLCLGGWGVSYYNRLIRLRNDIVNMYAQIDVQLKRRYDLIPNLVEVARKYLMHEAQTLQAVTEARQQAILASQNMAADPMRPSRAQALTSAELTLDSRLGKFFATAEAYPDLKGDATLRNLSEEITSTENRIGFARQAYNDAVLEYNNAAQEFPTSVVARACGFQVAPMLQSIQSPQEREPVRVSL